MKSYLIRKNLIEICGKEGIVLEIYRFLSFQDSGGEKNLSLFYLSHYLKVINSQNHF